MKTILVTGGTGMVGNSLQLENSHHDDKYNWVFLSSKDCDLRERINVFELFKLYTPSLVIHLAANVGGLYKNMRENTFII